MEKHLTFFARSNYREDPRLIGISDSDRLLHVHVLGKTGMGKSTLFETLMRQDLEHGHGFAFVDPHGDLADRLLDLVPRSRLHDVIYFNPADVEHPIAFNVLQAVDATQHHLVASNMVSLFKRFWREFWGPRTEYLLRNAILTLLESPGTTLLDISRLLVDEEFRTTLVAQISNPGVKQFWLGEFAQYPDRLRAEVIAPVQNKVGEFLLTPLVRNIVGQMKNRFDPRTLMDEGKILIVNAGKGQLGEDVSALLGSIVLTRLLVAAFSRSDVPEAARRPFFLYVDEFPSFATAGTFSALLSEARKYKLGAVLAHQYLDQLSDDLRGALFGNVGTLIAFRVGAEDARYLAREFHPVFSADDLINLGRYEVYMKLAIDGVTSRPFSATTLPPVEPRRSFRTQLVRTSRERYARPRHIIERTVRRRFIDASGGNPFKPRARPRSSVPNSGHRLPWQRPDRP